MSALDGVPADGNLKVLWVPAIDNTEAPTVAELTATGVVDLSCLITADGFNRAVNETAINDQRLCHTQDGEAPGRSSETLDLTYAFDPQSTSVTDNAAYVTLKQGTKGHVVARYGMPWDEEIAADQVVDVIRGTAGRQAKQAIAANDILKVNQKIFIPAGGVTPDAVVAA